MTGARTPTFVQLSAPMNPMLSSSSQSLGVRL
eukprot:CAMPEP_0206489498 /NCGR_PEP_ID=MMETSP0324_2-20121206/43292_1 /ASSEMBLY_ACC=CAM_ASM_000836 /TAXON_ID=2866 /ORGANISM="Crypthecodinium cohnii, Strain Seligo" /LENGTH=31 /DNA_ID= /DNA_START= /DNA_END= /DNA_ORIENTATION=